MKKPEHIASFKAGDSIPDWLLVFEPMNTRSNLGKTLFTADCHVMKVSSGYFVMPDRFDYDALLTLSGLASIDIRCADAPVAIPDVITTIGLPGGSAIDLGGEPSDEG